MAKSLSDFLKEIGEEQVTITLDGRPYTCTKTEALARKMYVMANGGVSEERGVDGNMVQVYHNPNPTVAKTIREFTEGKPAVEIQPEVPGNKKAGRFDGSISKRLNERLKPVQRPTITKP